MHVFVKEKVCGLENEIILKINYIKMLFAMHVICYGQGLWIGKWNYI